MPTKSIRELIPGLDEVDDEFREEQIEAFASIEPDICGMVSVRPFTPQMFIEMEIADNGFFRKREITATDVAIFLWRISFGFTRDNVELRTLFYSTISFLPFEQTRDELIDYVRRSWKCMPDWKGGRGPKSAGVWPSRLVHMFGKEYGWSEETVLNMPFRRLWQYAHRVMEEHDPKYRQKNPRNQALRHEWLVKAQAEADALKAAGN